MKEFWTYTALRIGLFLAAAAILYGIWMLFATIDSAALLGIVVVAALTSSVASIRLLSGPRQALADRIQHRASNMSAKFDELRAKEDAD